MGGYGNADTVIKLTRHITTRYMKTPVCLDIGLGNRLRDVGVHIWYIVNKTNSPSHSCRCHLLERHV